MTPDEAWIAEAQAPTVCRQILARRLRTRRLELEMKIGEVAERMGVSSSKISRLENEERDPQVEDVQRLTTIYGLSSDDAAELVRLAIGARQPSPWKAFHPASPARDYLELEAVARRIRAADLQQVHGLLQVPTYTSALLDGVGIADQEQILESRVLRRRRLAGARPLTIEVVVGEAALRMGMRTPEVMQKQIGHLLTVGAEPNIVVQVLLSSAGPSTGHPGGFNILEFGKEELDDVVYLEHLTGQLVIDDPIQVTQYENAFQALTKQALTPEASREFLESIQRQ